MPTEARYNRFNRGAFLQRYATMPPGKYRLRDKTWNGAMAEIANALSQLTITSFTGGTFETGPGGTWLAVSPGGSAAPVTPAWAWKVYNTTKGAAGQVQINGGDGFTAQLNGYVADVNGSPNNVAAGSPPVYPQLAVTGNGWIYAYGQPVDQDGNNPITVDSLDVYYGAALPANDTENPATYFVIPLATITNYAVVSGNPVFTVGNVLTYGPSIIKYCGGQFEWY